MSFASSSRRPLDVRCMGRGGGSEVSEPSLWLLVDPCAVLWASLASAGVGSGLGWSWGSLCWFVLLAGDCWPCAFVFLPQLDLLGLPEWLSLTSVLIQGLCLTPVWTVAPLCRGHPAFPVMACEDLWVPDPLPKGHGRLGDPNSGLFLQHLYWCSHPPCVYGGDPARVPLSLPHRPWILVWVES